MLLLDVCLFGGCDFMLSDLNIHVCIFLFCIYHMLNGILCDIVCTIPLLKKIL